MTLGFEDEMERQALLIDMSRRESRLGLVPLTRRLQLNDVPAPDDLSGLPGLLDDPEYLDFLGRHASLESRRLEYYDGIESATLGIRDMLGVRTGS